MRRRRPGLTAWAMAVQIAWATAVQIAWAMALQIAWPTANQKRMVTVKIPTEEMEGPSILTVRQKQLHREAHPKHPGGGGGESQSPT